MMSFKLIPVLVLESFKFVLFIGLIWLINNLVYDLFKSIYLFFLFIYQNLSVNQMSYWIELFNLMSDNTL